MPPKIPPLRVVGAPPVERGTAAAESWSTSVEPFRNNFVHHNLRDGIWYDTDKSGYAYVLVHGAGGTDVDNIARRLEGHVTNLESVPERIRRLGLAPPEGPTAA